MKDYPDDIIHAPGFHKEVPKTSGEFARIGSFVDEWGSEFITKQDGVIGEVKEPLVKSLDEISKVRVPEELLTIDKDKINDFCKNTDKFVLAGCCPRPFERLQFLRGTENVMMDLALQEDAIFKLLDTLHQFFLKIFELWAQTNVDGMMFMDDWGAQKALLISPDMWKKYFKPLYKEYIDIAHSRGKKIFMHSDGYIVEILQDLIEIGLDAVNSQLFCMDIEELGKKFKGKITFWGEIDRQNLLPNGTRQEITDAVNLIFKSLYQNGGTIAQMEFGPGAKPENISAAFDAWNSVL